MTGASESAGILDNQRQIRTASVSPRQSEYDASTLQTIGDSFEGHTEVGQVRVRPGSTINTTKRINVFREHDTGNYRRGGRGAVSRCDITSEGKTSGEPANRDPKRNLSIV